MGNPRVLILGERCPDTPYHSAFSSYPIVEIQSWLIAIQAGWRPNRRHRTLMRSPTGAHRSASIRESIDVLSPAFHNPGLLDGWTLSDAGTAAPILRALHAFASAMMN